MSAFSGGATIHKLICKAQAPDCEEKERERVHFKGNMMGSRFLFPCACMFIFDKLSHVARWPLENYSCYWLMTATMAFTSVTLCLECSITSGDATEMQSYQKIKYRWQLEFEVTAKVLYYIETVNKTLNLDLKF